MHRHPEHFGAISHPQGKALLGLSMNQTLNEPSRRPYVDWVAQPIVAYLLSKASRTRNSKAIEMHC